MAECVLAADLGGTKLALAAVDRSGGIRERRSERMDMSSVHASAAQLLRIARDLSARRRRLSRDWCAAMAPSGRRISAAGKASRWRGCCAESCESRWWWKAIAM